jgi:hypothetical protein
VELFLSDRRLVYPRPSSMPPREIVHSTPCYVTRTAEEVMLVRCLNFCKYEAEGGRRAQATQASGRSIEGGRALLKKRRAREVIWEREEELVVKESEEEKKGSPPTQYVEGGLASCRVEATVQSKILALLSRSLVQRIRGALKHVSGLK